MKIDFVFYVHLNIPEPFPHMKNMFVPGACREGCNPRCHVGSGGEQDEGSTHLQDFTVSRGQPLYESCGCVCYHTQCI